jgi:hypothetical protein
MATKNNELNKKIRDCNEIKSYSSTKRKPLW